MNLLTPDIGLLFWMTISFIFVFVILAKFGFPIVTRAVEKRNQYINDSLEAARQAEEKLTSVHTEAEKIMEKARDERNRIINEAQELRKKIESDARVKAEKEAHLQMQKAKDEIEDSKNKAIGTIRDEIAGISVKIAGKILNEQLKNDEEQKKLIEKLLEQEITTNV